ncbi:MAG: aminodeoxychorismate synthase component I [Reichenbachiella sp.]
MKTLNKKESILTINELAVSGKPFLMISDFKGEKNHILTDEEIVDDNILFYINGHTNNKGPVSSIVPVEIKKNPIPFKEYQSLYEDVHKELSQGNTYLLNLTCATDIELNGSLKDVFRKSPAKYKLWLNEEIVVFSPEIFVRIEDGKISSFPMKGTIDASVPGAKEIILSSKKEKAEHTTIVDLIRNDMSINAQNVRVEKFRYIDEVKTSSKHLLQVSSKIVGDLDKNYYSRLGEIIYSLLPAGSICGAPKKKTLEIIKKTEGYDRGYYTGVMGYFDGQSFDSGVMIRYIEKIDGNYIYKSGGGIHFLSDPETEYQEMIDKIYVPIH